MVPVLLLSFPASFMLVLPFNFRNETFSLLGQWFFNIYDTYYVRSFNINYIVTDI